MANKGIRTDKFTSKAGDFTVIKPKSGSKTTTKTSSKSTGKKTK